MTNILVNPSFENGWQDLDGVTQEPNGWTWHWYGSDTPNPHDPNPWGKFQQPELVHKSKNELPPDEHALFILDGEWTLKPFAGGRSWYGRLDQLLKLAPGTCYALFKVFGDLYKAWPAGGSKIWADDPQGRDGLFRFMVNGIGQDWQSITPGDWTTFELEFLHTATEVMIGAEFMCPFPLKSNGLFLDDWSLIKVEDEVPECDCVKPRAGFDTSVAHVIPQDATDERATEIFLTGWHRGYQMSGGSHDHVGSINVPNATVHIWDIKESEQHAYDEFWAKYYPTSKVVYENLIDDINGNGPGPGTVVAELLAPHVQVWQPGVENYLDKVRPEWIKLVGNMEAARHVKAISPNTKVLFRHHISHQEPYLKNRDVNGFLALFWDSLVANAQWIDCIEGLNETIGTHDISGIRLAVAFEVDLSDEMARRDIGVSTCLLHTAVGNPDHNEVALLVPAAEAAVRNNDYLGYHPYYPASPGKTAEWMTNEAEHFHMRHALSWDPVFVANGLYPQYLLTECGAVGGTPRADGRPGHLHPDAGWKSNLAHNGNLSLYLDHLMIWRKQLMDWNEDNANRIRGATIFTTGAGYTGWESFQMNAFELDELGRRVTA
jgi:hypothetical protein